MQSIALATLLPDPVKWVAPTPFRGLVVGSVQSGKTASMIGLTAVAFDRGYRIAVVLSGLKDDLRCQTALRFNTQLLRQGDVLPDAADLRTLPKDVERNRIAFAPPFHLDCHQYRLLLVRLSGAIASGENAVIVIKKNQASLNALRSVLRAAYDQFGVAMLPTLVLDDEADEASVDASAMPIPEAIANLWNLPNLPKVAYVGYTATSAANLLQDTDNPLFPADFVSLLRYPAAITGPLSFSEPITDDWYSGGECFYKEFGDELGEDSNFLVAPSVELTDLTGRPEENPSLRDAVRAYLVAGAYRLALLDNYSFEEAKRLPPPHSMLVQTSAAVSDHRRWFAAIGGMFDAKELPDKSLVWDRGAVERSILADVGPWETWFDRYSRSRERIHSERPHMVPFKPIPLERVLDLVPTVAAYVRIRAVNSDPEWGSALDFSMRLGADGERVPPRDLFVIAVGGAVLSRGLTIEGLCTTYFTRWNPSPTEDTILQLSRWFGYRGRHLEFCRVFTTEQIGLDLGRMHENDVDLRLQLARVMSEGLTPKDAALVLRANPRSFPTAKLGRGRLRDLAFSPYTNFLRDVELGDLSKHNEQLALGIVSEMRRGGAKRVTSAASNVKGLLSEGWEAERVATILDTLGFSRHNPSEEGNPAQAFCRPPDPKRRICEGIAFEEDPYQVAGYLRQWCAEAAKRGERPPRFNIGVAFGEMRTACEPFDFPLLNRTIAPLGKLEGGWTGRSAGWAGDAFFDSPRSELIEAGTALRLHGARGLLLLYVVHKNAIGKTRRGVTRQFHTPAFGIAIPAGGPVFRRVVIQPRT